MKVTNTQLLIIICTMIKLKSYEILAKSTMKSTKNTQRFQIHTQVFEVGEHCPWLHVYLNLSHHSYAIVCIDCFGNNYESQTMNKLPRNSNLHIHSQGCQRTFGAQGKILK